MEQEGFEIIMARDVFIWRCCAFEIFSKRMDIMR